MRLKYIFVLIILLASLALPSQANEASYAISPKLLRDMLKTSDSHFNIANRNLISNDSIPFPAAIAFDAKGCFSGYFPSADLGKLTFECIEGSDTLALSEIAPDAAKQTENSLVVMKLVPSFADGRCSQCETIDAGIRHELDAKGMDAKIFLADIAI